jgi:hypothetical protein
MEWHETEKVLGRKAVDKKEQRGKYAAIWFITLLDRILQKSM